MFVVLYAGFYMIFLFLENVSVCFLDPFLLVSRRSFNRTGWLFGWSLGLNWRMGGSNTRGWLFGWSVGLDWRRGGSNTAGWLFGWLVGLEC